MVPPSKSSKLASEMIGTMILVLTVTCNAWGGTAFCVTSIGFSLMVGIYCLGDVSGANFNPAVSLALGLAGKLPWLDVGKYVLMQILGGVAGGIIGRDLCKGTDLAATAPKLATASHMSAGLAEIFYTALLCFVVMNVAATRKNKPNNYYGLAIGLSVVAGGHASGRASGGLLNPAVALGIFVPEQIIPGVDDMTKEVACLVVAVAAEIVGALLAVGMFRLVRPEEFTDEEEPEPGFLQRMSAELLGTFYLVFTLMNVIYSEDKIGCWPVAACLASLVYSLGSVSGAHFNPAVTLALRLRGVVVPSMAMYPLAQVVGSICGACMARCIYTESVLDNQSFYGTGAKGTGFQSMTRGVDAEMFFTFLLVFVVVCIATVPGKDLRDMVGLTVGACVVAAGTAVGRTSGAHLNPAVTIGLMTVNLIFHGGTSQLLLPLLWIVSQLIGTVCAVAVSRISYPAKLSEEEALLPGGEPDDMGYAAAKLASIPPMAMQAAATSTRKSFAAPSGAEP